MTKELLDSGSRKGGDKHTSKVRNQTWEEGSFPLTPHVPFIPKLCVFCPLCFLHFCSLHCSLTAPASLTSPWDNSNYHLMFILALQSLLLLAIPHRRTHHSLSSASLICLTDSSSPGPTASLHPIPLFIALFIQLCLIVGFCLHT